MDSQKLENVSGMNRPLSCDTFVVLPPATDGGCVIFGKNSDRPCDEVQEVLYKAAQDHAPGSKVQCTYIEIDQVAHTYEVVLSKPAWMWGAEMGANEHGVCIGNEAVWTKMCGPEDEEERLLGMDLVRLALERSSTSETAVDIITKLLTQHGLGGSFYACPPGKPSSSGPYWSSSFLVCDRREAWVVEAVGEFWAAEKITSGFRNISNQLTIRTKIDAMSDGLKEKAEEKGFWKASDGPFDFAKVFSDMFEETELKQGDKPTSRQLWGTKLLQDYTKEGNFSVQDMFKVLRHQPSGICMKGGFLTTGSQVSMVTPLTTKSAAVHWFTGTPNPAESMFKPFIFCEDASMGCNTTSPEYGLEDPARVKPRFQTEVDRKHTLWKSHEKVTQYLERGDKMGDMILGQMMELEKHCVTDMEEFIKKFDEKSGNADKMHEIFKHMVDIEMNFYR